MCVNSRLKPRAAPKSGRRVSTNHLDIIISRLGVRVDLGPLPGSGATSVAKPEGNQARLHLLFLESGNALTSVPYDEP